MTGLGNLESSKENQLCQIIQPINLTQSNCDNLCLLQCHRDRKFVILFYIIKLFRGQTVFDENIYAFAVSINCSIAAGFKSHYSWKS